MKIEIFDKIPGRNVWFTSDTHYSHKNICAGTTEWTTDRFTRNFRTLDEMDDAIVNNLNRVVMRDDILIHLGDWSFGGVQNISKFRNRIVCENIHLVLGNHDHHIKKNTDNLQSLFKSINTILDLQVLVNSGIELPYTRYDIVCCHYPFASWENMNKGSIHLHGHIHLKKEYRLHCGKSMDVGMDGNDLNPHNLLDIINVMKSQPIAKTTLPVDHHE